MIHRTLKSIPAGVLIALSAINATSANATANQWHVRCGRLLSDPDFERLIARPISPRLSFELDIERDFPSADGIKNYQMAIWTMRQRGLERRADSLSSQVEHALEYSEVESEQPFEEGVSGARLLMFADGLAGVFKPLGHWASCPGCEVAAYKFDKLVGFHLVPVTVSRVHNGVAGSIQLFIPNAVSAKKRGVNTTSERIKLLDYFLNNTDRHNSNYLFAQGLRGQEYEFGIDHGLTFHAAKKMTRIDSVSLLTVPSEIRRRLAHISLLDLNRELSGLIEPELIEELDRRRTSLLHYLDRKGAR